MRKVFLTIILFFASVNLFGSHLNGGEITWKCLPSGAFIFQLKLYRDCTGVPAPSSVSIRVHNYSPNPALSLVCPLINAGGNDLSPQGPGCVACTPNSPVGSLGTVSEWVYESAPVFLSGTPPPAGWIFTWDSCCRNNNITNLLNPGSQGFTLRAIMYPYNGQSMNPCFDSSPSFVEPPSAVFCTQNLIVNNHNAFDPDCDSLVYDWAPPYGSAGASFPPPIVPFAPGFLYYSPFPGISMNPSNIPAQLDSTTGYMFSNTNNPGMYVYVIKVTSYRNGVKVSEIFSENLTVATADCPISSSPVTYNNSPVVTSPVMISVAAGNQITYNVSAVDLEYLPQGGPGFGLPQTVTINPLSPQFGSNYTNPNAGCLTPPCAILNALPPVSGSQNATLQFSWQTKPDHVGCNSCYTDYHFSFRSTDNYCQAQGVTKNIVTVRVFLPVPIATPNPGFISGPDTVFENQTGLVYSIQPVSGVNTYIWTVPQGATILSGQGSPSIKVDWGTNNGPVTVTCSNSCGFSQPTALPVTTISPVGIDLMSKTEQKINTYPNPAQNHINVDLHGFEGSSEVFIYNSNGREAIHHPAMMNSKGSYKIDISSLSPGLYSVVVKNHIRSTATRFFKQ